MDSCIEPTPRPAWRTASRELLVSPQGAGLPSYQELISFTDNASGALAAGGELTAEVYPSQPNDAPMALVVVNQSGDVNTVPDTFAGGRQFRCAANAING